VSSGVGSTEPPNSGGAGFAGAGAGTTEESLTKVEDLLARLESVRRLLDETDDPDRAIDILQELAELAKETEAELQRAKRAAETEAAAPPDVAEA
jgi:exonuclease VII small subunit